MKKTILLFLILNIFTSVINVSIDGEDVVFTDQPPTIVDGRTLVPVRAVFEHIGFDVSWEEETQTVTLVRDGDIIMISVGETEFIFNEEIYELSVPAQIINGRTMLPIRALLESVGYDVEWDASENTVIITGGFIETFIIPGRRLTENEIVAWFTIYETEGANVFELEVIRLTNIERAAEGLPPLEENERLMMAARFKAQSMFDLDYFSHESPVYGEFSNIARMVFGVSPNVALSENIARGHRTPEDVVQGWMGSGEYRDNILNPENTQIGVGFYNNIWVQNFSN